MLLILAYRTKLEGRGWSRASSRECSCVTNAPRGTFVRLSTDVWRDLRRIVGFTVPQFHSFTGPEGGGGGGGGGVDLSILPRGGGGRRLALETALTCEAVETRGWTRLTRGLASRPRRTVSQFRSLFFVSEESEAARRWRELPPPRFWMQIFAKFIC